MKEDLVRTWFGAVRDAADEGERELPADLPLRPVQRAKLRILLRQDQSDFLSLSIRCLEDIGSEAANAVKEQMYSELMEDAIAGIWSAEENMELLRFLGLCTEGIGDTATFCELFRKALGEESVSTLPEPDALGARVKARADRHMARYMKEREKQRPEEDDDSPPPWMDEFEYIDWCITH